VRSLLSSLLILLLISACSSNSRYQQQHDSTPTRLPTAEELQDAIPRAEINSRGGNRDYQVRGKNYQVLASADNFRQSGVASWYGKKFHGHLTSNGETYNMYSMSAAHKNLPLPTYVKVTNTDNNKTVIVRVNDRGPFHHNRIIDLSYSAAYKLDMLKTGTANVIIEAITNFSKKSPNIIAVNSHQQSESMSYFIQVLATNSKTQAESTANAISHLFQLSTKINKKQKLYKVHVGPINNSTELNSTIRQLRNNGYPNAFKLPN